MSLRAQKTRACTVTMQRFRNNKQCNIGYVASTILYMFRKKVINANYIIKEMTFFLILSKILILIHPNILSLRNVAKYYCILYKFILIYHSKRRVDIESVLLYINFYCFENKHIGLISSNFFKSLLKKKTETKI